MGSLPCYLGLEILIVAAPSPKDAMKICLNTALQLLLLSQYNGSALTSVLSRQWCSLLHWGLPPLCATHRGFGVDFTGDLSSRVLSALILHQISYQ